MLKPFAVALLILLCAASASAGFWYLARGDSFGLRGTWDQSEWDVTNWE